MQREPKENHLRLNVPGKKRKTRDGEKLFSTKDLAISDACTTVIA